MSRKESACGKAKSRDSTKNPFDGVAYMDTKDMKQYIGVHGTDAAKRALADIPVAKQSRQALCVILHMFRKGREIIAKSGASKNFRLTPSPNRAKVPSPPRGVVPSAIIPVRPRGRTAASAMSKPRSANSSPNYSPNKMAKILAFTKGTERRRLLRAGLKGLRKRKGGVVRRIGGVEVRMFLPKRPKNTSEVNEVPVDVDYYQESGSGSNSNKSQKSNYGGSGSNNNNGIRRVGGNFQNLRAKFNKVTKPKPGSRFAEQLEIRNVKNVKPSARVAKRTRSYSYLPVVEKTKGNKTARVPTSSRVYGGSRSGISRLQLKAASEARWKLHEKMVRNNPNMSNEQKAALANSLLQKTVENVRKGLIALPTLKKVERPQSVKETLASLGLGSNSNSSSGASASASPKARRVKERLTRKLRGMTRRKVAKAPLAEEWERSMLKGPQGEKVSLRKTSAERARYNEIMEQLVKFKSPSANSNRSSSGSPVVTKTKKSASGMKSLRKK
jgi:hypothetical protein